MDDATTIALITGLFTLNYIALGAIWKQLNKYSNALRIICREHSEHHGGKEILL